MPLDDPLIDQRIKGYQIQSILGEGGMGRVYLATHPLIGKQVAIKVLRSEYSEHEKILERFFFEARAVNDIRHENVIDILDFDKTPKGEPFIIMEYLEGKSLSDIIEVDAPFSKERLGNIALQICSALFAAHQKDIIHRDLKKDNVFLVTRGGNPDFVKVLDFGVAKLLSADSAPLKTKTGSLVGTPYCMAPEQASGDEIDARTDIYSLGVILYEMATGNPPFFDANPYVLVAMHITQQPPSPRNYIPSLDPALEALILRCLEKDKRKRFPSMKALSSHLMHVCYGTPLLEGTSTPPDTTHFFSRKKSAKKRFGTPWKKFIFWLFLGMMFSLLLLFFLWLGAWFPFDQNTVLVKEPGFMGEKVISEEKIMPETMSVPTLPETIPSILLPSSQKVEAKTQTTIPSTSTSALSKKKLPKTIPIKTNKKKPSRNVPASKPVEEERPVPIQ